MTAADTIIWTPVIVPDPRETAAHTDVVQVFVDGIKSYTWRLERGGTSSGSCPGLPTNAAGCVPFPTTVAYTFYYWASAELGWQQGSRGSTNGCTSGSGGGSGGGGESGG